ncbi:glycosyltransferase family 87 protein [Bradyrhizobium sp. sBnM-33]|uniref:glycosyltransferase family 87 protein n=1 Tax=Bradyrhizobium sp. sBnM-33 TaxID=2831780 RepID=UPI001BD04CD9|nr:glycosyltransferase family 87 protein [Bradyrhizobium sp. sBnM-33]WOH51698.1 glycosyltransferase family 87 protein [Bradyrhizobium sp. sBnM-33]
MTASLSTPKTARDQAPIPEWLVKVCLALAMANLVLCPVAYFSSWWIYDSKGLGIPTDFINVWAAGRLVLDGVPAQAYDWDIQKQIEVAKLGQDFVGYFAWHYPPPFLFVASLLAMLPFSVGYAGWVYVSMLPYLAVMRAIVGRNFGLLLALAIPTVLVNSFVGQNGFLTAALIGGTLYLIPVRPVLAGICLGLLTYKPQYGLLFPVVLIAAGHWRVFVSAGVTAVVVAFASWLAFGIESWLAFFHWMPRFSQAFLTEGKATWWKLQSIFSLVRYFGGSEPLGWAFQWVLTASVAVVLALMWRSRVPYALKAAALAAGTLLTTPYLFMYDMMVLAIPIGFLVRIGLKSGFRAYELPALGAVIALIGCYMFTGIPTGLGATLIVGGLVLRRAGPWWRRETAPALAAAGA